MTFKKFEELFKTKYPEGEVVAHGQFGGTERNKKTTVIFKPEGKCYEYYGAYEDVLCRVGIDVISKHRYQSMKASLEWYKKDHGTPKLFGGTVDHSETIARLTKEIEDIEKNTIIV